MAKNRNSRSKSKPPVAMAQVAAPQQAMAVVAAEPEAPVTKPILAGEAAGAQRREGEPARAPIAKAARSVEMPSHEAIARRAYELWLRRGAPMGSHLEDWLSAERELTAA